MGKNKIPKLEDLNPNQPDYVERLDAGLRRADDLYAEESKAFERLLEGYFERIKHDLESSGNGSEEATKYLTVRLKCHNGERCFRAVMFVKDCSERRLLERKLTEQQMQNLDRIYEKYAPDYNKGEKPIVENIRALEQAIIDFRGAIEGLTKARRINKPKDSMKFHHYVIIGKGVYEIFVNLQEMKITEPTINPNLKASDFSNESYVEELGRKADREGELACMISNPSKMIPPMFLLEEGTRIIASQNIEELIGAMPVMPVIPLTQHRTDLFN